MIIALTIVIALGTLSMLLGVPGPRQGLPGNVLGGASTVSMARSMLTPTLFPDGRHTMIAQWGFLIAVLSLAVVDLCLLWKDRKRAGSGVGV